MIPVKTTSVCYCSVSNGGRALYTYSNGDDEMEKLAALCLEMIPPHHLWYFHTMGDKTFGFLMDNGYVYFAIVKEKLCNSALLRFLHQLKDEFKRGSARSLQEQLVTSLEHVNNLHCPAQHSASTNNGINQQTETPLQGNLIKQGEMMKDHVMDIESAADRAPSDGEANFDSEGASVSKISSSQTQTVNKRWCRLVLIALAVDAAVCTLLFVIWMVICNGIRCVH